MEIFYMYVLTVPERKAPLLLRKNSTKNIRVSAPFSYNFLDKSFESLYKSEQRSGLLFNLFAGIAIFISCLGLFGLSTYTAQVKTKEIGIRKVLGASVCRHCAIDQQRLYKACFYPYSLLRRWPGGR